jgi:hypothetical protein
LTTFIIFLPEIFAPLSEGAPFRLVETGDNADCERDERLPWRHELKLYLAIAGHPPPDVVARVWASFDCPAGTFLLSPRPGLLPSRTAAEYAVARLYFVWTIFQSPSESANFSAIQIET